MQRHAVLPVATLTLALGACDPPAGTTDAGTTPDASPTADGGGEGTDAAVTGDWSFEVIETRPVTILEQPREAELIRAHRPDGGRSYLIYIAAPRADAPMVVMTQPYAGIDWTGEDADARWAALGPGLHPDDDAPAYDGDDVVAYEPQTPQQAAEAATVWAANGLAVVHAYGRFYTGGTIEDDVLDAAAPYHFAASRDAALDLEHIGVWGGSWGGFMALFGASAAPDGAEPAAVAALWGPSDFSDLWAYTDRIATEYPTPTQAEAFFSTYRRRIAGATGGPAPTAGFAPFDRDALCAGFGTQTSVLSLHDDWDTLIPVEQTRSLLDACPRVEAVYWHRQSPIDYTNVMLDHGVSFREEPEIPMVFTLSYAYTLTRLIPTGTIYLVMNEPSVVSFLGLVRAQQMAGGDASDALARFRELADPRVSALTPGATAFEPAADVLARAYTTVYGRTFTAASLRTELETALPAP